MSVETFDPGKSGEPVDDAVLRDLSMLAENFTGDKLTLPASEAARFAPLVTRVDWYQYSSSLSDIQIEGLIRIFTLGEMTYSSWAAGEKSPVVPLVKALKSRGTYDAGFTRWIKAHTTNRFLPHGSLLDRL